MPKEEFFTKAQALTEAEMRKLGMEKKEKKFPSEVPDTLLAASFRNPETGKEYEISLDIERESTFFKSFYQKNLDLDLDKSEILLIWQQNYQEMKTEIETYGYDTILIIPDTLPEAGMLNEKLIETMEETVGGKKKTVADTYQGDNFKKGGSFAGVKNVETPGYRIILCHSEQNLFSNSDANPFLKATLGKNIMALTGLDPAEVERRISGNQGMPVDFEAKIGNRTIRIKAERLSLEEYIIFQRVYFEKTGKHPDENGCASLLKSSSGSRVVFSYWDPGARQLCVDAGDPGDAGGRLGLRLSRSFKKSS